eukprot:14376919-Heterocapsa_arctica.AAC.1
MNIVNDKCWAWKAHDRPDDEASVDQLALKFGTPQLARAFKEAFDNAKEVAETYQKIIAESANIEKERMQRLAGQAIARSTCRQMRLRAGRATAAGSVYII